MPKLSFLLLILQGLVFLVWVVQMFRMLFRISRHARAKHERTGGGYFVWAGHSFAAYRWFFTAPETRTHRNRVIALTVALMALVVSRPLLFVAAP